jgi:hypothetical protein
MVLAVALVSIRKSTAVRKSRDVMLDAKSKQSPLSRFIITAARYV